MRCPGICNPSVPYQHSGHEGLPAGEHLAGSADNVGMHCWSETAVLRMMFSMRKNNCVTLNSSPLFLHQQLRWSQGSCQALSSWRTRWLVGNTGEFVGMERTGECLKGGKTRLKAGTTGKTGLDGTGGCDSGKVGLLFTVPLFGILGQCV